MKRITDLLKTTKNWMFGHKLRAVILALVLVFTAPVAGKGTNHFPMLRLVGSRAVEHSVGVDQSGWRRTEPDSGRGQSHAAVSAGRGLATEPDQPGEEPGRRSCKATTTRFRI